MQWRIFKKQTTQISQYEYVLCGPMDMIKYDAIMVNSPQKNIGTNLKKESRWPYYTPEVNQIEYVCKNTNTKL